MNNHEKEQAFKAKKAEMQKKYDSNIKALNRYYNGMETFICFDVLCANARAYARGEFKEIWPGGGKVDMDELIKDVKELDSFIVYPEN